LIPCTEAEGPGRRFAIWTQGCPLRCPGCCNPEMLPLEGGEAWSVSDLARQVIRAPGIEGVTLVGGEPFAQADACAALAEAARAEGLGVMVFTGYTLDELTAPGVDPGWARLLGATDLVVDGRYERERPETRRRWVGSSNQRLHFLSDRYDPDDPRLAGPNSMELRFDGRTLSVNGWPAAAEELLS
jgi:anaerobic ribonucleoside-triphosphate reductase activating protein